MYLHLGGEVAVKSSDVIGIFDIERCSVSKITVDFLNNSQKKKQIVYISNDMPKSFIVTEKLTYISNVSNQTICRRTGK